MRKGLRPTATYAAFLEVVQQGLYERLSIYQQLVLKVNRDTNQVSIVTGEAAVSIDGYAIRSSLGGLNAGNWTSLQDGSVSDWRESPQAGTDGLLAELKPTGDFAVTLAAPIELGAVCDLPSPTELKQELEDIQFEYYLQDGTTVEAQVIYEGEKRFNDLVLVVDPVDRDAMLENQSGLAVSIDGYTIQSESLLSGDGDWLSLDDQDNSTWTEANGSEGALTELESEGETLLSSGQVFNLGRLFSTESSSGTQDLTFSYLFPGDSSFTEGVVVYRDVDFSSVPGDYNGDTVVDAADYAVWRDTVNTAASPGSGADGDGDIDADDYLVWSQNFGGTAASPADATQAATVPEPAGLVLLALAIGLAVQWTQSDRHERSVHLARRCRNQLGPGVRTSWSPWPPQYL